MGVPGFLQTERVPFVDVQIVRAGEGEESGVQMFERLARDPGASVEKIERLMALWERSEARKADAAFNAAMSTAQKEMKPIAADATNPLTKSRYASYAALDRALRPIYTAHGFGLSFDTADAPQPETVRVLCYVTHLGGASRTYRLDMPADGKGARGGDVMTKTHATGSALSYGMRYLLKLIFNIAVGEADDDGNAATAKPPVKIAAPVPHPSGYLKWLDDLRQSANEGTARLERAWYDAPKAFRQHLDATNLKLRHELKAIAARKVA
jgi:hypothetical protein